MLPMEERYYLPREEPDWEWVCPAEMPNGRPFDPDECGESTEPGQVLCPHHQRTLPQTEQECYARHYADQTA